MSDPTPLSETVPETVATPRRDPNDPFRGFDGSGRPIYDYGEFYDALGGAKR